MNIIVAVEATVYAVILAVISYIDRCKYIHCIAKMFLSFILCFSCHLLQIQIGAVSDIFLSLFHFSLPFLKSLIVYMVICIPCDSSSAPSSN